MRLSLLLVVLAVTSSCARLAQNVVARGEAARMLPRFANCPDGEPVRLLIERRCPGGVCGYSCLPHRWEQVGDREP